jgi:hypothetical protein
MFTGVCAVWLCRVFAIASVGHHRLGDLAVLRTQKSEKNPVLGMQVASGASVNHPRLGGMDSSFRRSMQSIS